MNGVEDVPDSPPESSNGTATGPTVRYTLETLPPELEKYYHLSGDRYLIELDTGINGIDCFGNTIRGSGWTRSLGIALHRKA